MNDDYLWDKTGQPDPQVQQLEEILGTLRYQPRPLEIPRDLPVGRRRSYLPLLAIAATIVMALLATGVWLRVRSGNVPKPQQAKVSTPEPAVEEKVTPATAIAEGLKKAPIVRDIKRRSKPATPGFGKLEREEALAAKDQLMFALRLASEKLNLAHRKTQSMTPANQIKNQHRIG